MSTASRTAAVKSAKSTAAQSVPGYAVMAAVIGQLDGLSWWHLAVAALPVIDALVTWLHRMKVPHIGTVGAYIEAVEEIAAEPSDDVATDVDQAEGA